MIPFYDTLIGTRSTSTSTRIWVTASLYSTVRMGEGINKMILANNSNATRAEKNTRDYLRPKRTSECIARRCNFIHGRIRHPASHPFSGTKTRPGCAMGDGGRGWGERLMRAMRERTNGRRAVRDFRTRTYMHGEAARVQGCSDCYTSTAGIVIATPAANPRFYLYLCSRVPANRDCAHPHAHERPSELLARRTRGTSIPVSSTYFYNLGQFGDRRT